MICGIDEAGRGAVLGPLVVAGACFSAQTVTKLQGLGVKDSKLLSPEKREELFPELIKLASGLKITVINADEIDNRFNNNKNLNTLEVEAFQNILSELKPKEAFVDSVLRDPEKLKAELSKATDAKLTVEHKADLNYPVVGAASIIAKVTRDRAIREIERKHNLTLGSGYPSDPTTVDFLKKSTKDYDFVRKSWAAYKRVHAEASQSRLQSFQ